MKITVEVGVFLVSLAVGVAGLFSQESSSAIDDIIDGFLSVTGKTKEKLSTVYIRRAMRREVTFWCCNSHTRTIQKTSINDPLMHSILDLNLPFIFLIHGFTDNVNAKWIQNMLRELCRYRLTNACGVDWRRLANFVYPMSAKHTIKVGKYVAAYVKFLLTNGVPIDNIILVGYSLGAHVAGSAGSTLRGRVPLIIGLDPAGPLKTYPVLKPIAERLDPTDAKFVQAIYTGIMFMGSATPVATQNFYPAGGINPQPWCYRTFLEFPYAPATMSCSHFVAVELFRRSILNVIEGTKCVGIIAYSAGKCRYKPKDRMGLDTKKIPGKFYLDFDTPELEIKDFVQRLERK